MKLKNIHVLTDFFIKEQVYPGEIVIDATLGNGHDGLKLLRQLNHKGHVYGFDIQETALISSKKLFESHGYKNFTLFKKSHVLMGNYIEPETVSMIIFNLGYLPRGNKDITTTYENTYTAIQIGLSCLKKDGLMLIACYPGHDAGMTEYKQLMASLKNLDQQVYNTFHGHFINQKNEPPALYVIHKR